MSKCKRHPKYRGLRIPRARDKETGELCEFCIRIFNEVKAAGIKEDRAPKTSRDKLLIEPVAEQPVEAVEEQQETIDTQNDEQECPDDNEMDECDDCCTDDDESILGYVIDEDWDFEDDEIDIDENE